MSYTPRNPPANAAELSGFLAIELQKIAQEWSQPQPSVYLSTSYAEPAKPREGMIAKADGTTWNPGSGSGVYCYIAGAWVLLHSNGRELLTGDRTYYVRTDGSNSNTGLIDTAGGAFLTIQKAVDVALSLDAFTYQVTIQVGDGTYTNTVSMNSQMIGSKQLIIKGNATTPDNVLLSGTDADLILAYGDSNLQVQDMKLVNTGVFMLRATKRSHINFSGINFGACGNQQLRADDLASITCVGDYKVSGSAVAHISYVSGAVIRIQNFQITLVGTPTFSTAFAWGTINANLLLSAMTYVGTFVGKRYLIEGNSVMYSNSAPTTTLPGTILGTESTGGRYI